MLNHFMYVSPVRRGLIVQLYVRMLLTTIEYFALENQHTHFINEFNLSDTPREIQLIVSLKTQQEITCA